MSERWVYEAANVEGYVITALEGWRYVVDPSDHEGRYGPIYREADARLIAAAPELLEALEDLFHLIADAHDGERVFTFNMQRKARAAIAKAKGS